MNPLTKAIVNGAIRLLLTAIAGSLATHGIIKADTLGKQQLAELSGAVAVYLFANYKMYLTKLKVNSLLFAAWALSPHDAWCQIKLKAKELRERGTPTLPASSATGLQSNPTAIDLVLPKG